MILSAKKIDMTDTEQKKPEPKTETDKKTTEPSQTNQTSLATSVKLTGRMLNFSRLQLQGDDIDAMLAKVKEKLTKKLDANLPVLVSLTTNLPPKPMVNTTLETAENIATPKSNEENSADNNKVEHNKTDKAENVEKTETTDKSANENAEKSNDLTDDDLQTFDLEKLWHGLWALGLQPIGMVTGAFDSQAQALKIAIFPADGQRIDRKTDKKTDTKKAEKSDDKNHSNHENLLSQNSQPIDNQLILADDSNNHQLNIQRESNSNNVEGDLVHHQILRSGQSINHVGGDVILTKGINAGAEAITDYSLHIYGKAEGRLVAGATGDKNARIFCLQFNPSLVSVAGTYCLKENIPTELLGKAVEVSFDSETGLVFNLMA